MIVFMTVCYVALLGLLVWRKVLPNTKWTWLSTIVWVILLLLVLWFPMQWGAPGGQVRVYTHTVEVIPNVNGVVTEVPVRPNRPVKKGDVLFKIDPTPYKAQVDVTKALLAFQKLRLRQFAQLARTAAGTKFQVEQTEAQVRRLEAQLVNDEWNLTQTVVRAPSDGYVVWLGLRAGARVVNFPFKPAMTFVDTSRQLVGAQVEQIYMRNVRVGQTVELAFKTRPGQIYTGKVFGIYRVASEGQVLPRGTVPTAQPIKAEPFFVRIALDRKDTRAEIPPGTVGTVAIYTEHVKMTHVIRKVVIRMDAYLSYIVPSL